MSVDALCIENDSLRRQLAERDAQLAEREARLTERESLIRALEAEIKLLSSELLKSTKNREELQARIQSLVQLRRRAAELAPGQTLLGFLDDLLPAPEAEVEAPAHVDEAPDGETEQDGIRQRNKPKRPARRIDTSNLVIEHVYHELAGLERICPVTGKQLVPISEKLEDEIVLTPSQLTRRLHHRTVYGLDATDPAERQAPPVIAPGPVRPLEGSIAGPALLGSILTNKYLLHLPLYRQEQDFERRGLRLPRQTMCDWVLGCADALKPIANALLEQIRAGPVMQLDDTPIRCQRGRGQGKYQAYLWTLCGPEVEGVVFRFTPGRSADLIAKELEGFEGTLVGDGYSGNGAAAKAVSEKIVMAGCWAHSIRKLEEARAEAPEASLYAVDIRVLFQVERRADEENLDHEARKQLRAQLSRAPLARIFRRLRGWRKRFSEAGKMADALRYLENQRKPLRRFLDDGRVPIYNNRCENSIRPVAVGRRNWLFAGRDRGGEAAATIYTLIESCRLAGVEPGRYLEDVLVRLVTHPASRVNELIPAEWARKFGQK
jgi:hypothetical protein